MTEFLPEKEEERKHFDRMIAELGISPLEYIRLSLKIWAGSSPKGGTYGRMCAIMVNELTKVIEGES